MVTAEGLPAQGARIVVTSPTLPGVRSTEADGRGRFRLPSLPSGTYEVRIAYIGHRPLRLTGVGVRLGSASSLGETRLEAQGVELEELVVLADRPLLDLTTAGTSTHLTAERFRDLPTGRSIADLIPLAPDAVHTGLPGDQANIAGSTGLENAYFVDGANTSDPLGGTSLVDLPYDFIREVQVRSGGYEAEYGRATGGVINAVTYSGGNEFAGSGFGYFTDDGMRADPQLAGPDAFENDYTSYDVGASFGGPILRDRLWFFAAYNPTVVRRQGSVTGVDLPADRRVEHRFAGKLTWQAGPATDLSLSVYGDPETQDIADPDDAPGGLGNMEAIVGKGRFGTVVASALLRRRFGRALAAEIGLARYSRRSGEEGINEFGRTAPNLLDKATGVLSGGYGTGYEATTRRTSVRASLAAALGSHSVKLGAEYESNHRESYSDWSAEPGSPGGFLDRFEDGTWRWNRGFRRTDTRNRVPTVYLQDSWRVDDRVTLNYGLRWDAQYLVASTGEIVQRFTDQWQPRLGFVYATSAAGTGKFFGSYARFYEQIGINLPASFHEIPGYVIIDYPQDPRLDQSNPDTVRVSEYLPVGTEPERDLRGQSVDEYLLGYEMTFGPGLRGSLRGVHRRLRWAVEDALGADGERLEIGNPGRGNLAHVPKAVRNYHGLVLTLEKPAGRRTHFQASYVLSRSWGNYVGLYDYAFLGGGGNISYNFDNPLTYPNSTGLLPNDRTHVVKLWGAVRVVGGVSAGIIASWQSGTPRSAYVIHAGHAVFTQPRGSDGRTPSVFDLGLRLRYEPRGRVSGSLHPAVYVDLTHVGNERVALFQAQYLGEDTDGDGVPEFANADHGKGLEFQPPRTLRVGMSLEFGRRQ